MIDSGVQRILVVAAHPDDEALGCGATLVCWADAGAHVEAVFMTDGESARAGGRHRAGARREAAERAAAILGVADLAFHDFPDNRMDTVPLLDVVQAVESHVERVRPEVVLTHHTGDLNVDHERTAHATWTACRPLPGASVRELLAFEVLSSTDWGAPAAGRFAPQLYVDVTETFERKLRVLEAYESEMRAPPHARSIEAVQTLARYRGTSVGLELAEAFEIVRAIQ